METRTSETSQVLAWIAAISLIVFCGAGVAALMGWIPSSAGKPEVPVFAKPWQPAAPVVVAAPCTDCGVVQSVREVKAKGKSSGLGAAGGAVARNKIEEPVKFTTSYEITVDLDDGTSRVIIEASAPSWRNGDKVRIVNGVIELNA